MMSPRWVSSRARACASRRSASFDRGNAWSAGDEVAVGAGADHSQPVKRAEQGVTEQWLLEIGPAHRLHQHDAARVELIELAREHLQVALDGGKILGRTHVGERAADFPQRGDDFARALV